ncbi:hypothetical protein DFQ28_002418 [Apophysomyces sp. BC1034]|nr:hypothetical protein DFQ28_002418 [Apophysomyces sp. BC1034]
MRIVGRGAFGKVRIVEHRESCQLYALKYISKEECIQMDAVRNIVRERMILEQLDHPFLCRLRFAFQDSEYMYMVTDLMLGGDLYYHISRERFTEDVIRFWFAELATAVKYLHFNRVVHRDIKPQNILMDDKGHVHLADFNIASHLHDHKQLTSNSGTAYYMAPEVYKGGGYNEAVDWWSLGITMYECVYGKRPFEHETTDELRAAVRRGYIHYPTNDRNVSGECLAAIQGFLEMNPNKRLGQGDAGWAALVRHPFFRSVDWHRLERKTTTPPFQPAADQNNFELTFDLEELLLEDKPVSVLTRRQRKPKRQSPVDVLTREERELQVIEETFKMFDFTIFEKYEGFKDPIKMTVGDPPDWVKPAFEGADQGDLLPIKRITTAANSWQADESVSTSTPTIPAHHESSWRGPNRSASTSNLAAVAGIESGDIPWKRRSLGTLRVKQQQQSSSPLADNMIPASLSEEYAMSLQGIRKKQSTRSFRERRERDRKSINTNQDDAKLKAGHSEMA